MFLSIFCLFSFYPQDSSQIKLLKELMDLQKDMIVMMLSLLEGSLVHPNNKKQTLLVILYI